MSSLSLTHTHTHTHTHTFLRARTHARHRVLENVREMWTEMPQGAGKGAKPRNKDRSIPKMFLRGDSVVLVMSVPSAPAASA